MKPIKKSKYTPKLLKPWVKPDNYAGDQYPDYYRTGFGQSRDSELMERCNFSAALDELGGESARAVIVTRASHWAVGWVESILVHKSAYAKLRIADDLAKRMDDYPLLDEDSFYALEHEELCESYDCYRDELIDEVLKATGLPSVPKRREEADAVASACFHEQAGYAGPENAWVDKSSLQRFAHTYECERLAKDGNNVASNLIATCV